MTEIATVALSIDEARALTDEVKADAAALWAKLLALYEGGAHKVLGYSNWMGFCAEEFSLGASQSYRVLDAARVVEALPASPNGGTPTTEAVARELVPVLRDNPEKVEEVWGEVVEEHGPTPTAPQVREVVQQHKPDAAKSQHEFTTCPTCGHRVRADKPLRPRKENA